MGQIQPPLPSLHSSPPSPVWRCQSCFCQNADISKRCQRLGVKLRGRAKLARCDFVQMCLASAFWLSIIPLNYLFYKADYVFTFAGQLGFFFLPPELSVVPKDAFIFSFQHLPFLPPIFFAFLLEYDIALKRINVILGYIRQGYFQKGKYFSSTLIWGTEKASLKILRPIWVTSDQKRESDVLKRVVRMMRGSDRHLEIVCGRLS